MNRKIYYFILGFGLGLIFSSLMFVIYYNLTSDNTDIYEPSHTEETAESKEQGNSQGTEQDLEQVSD